ncbi:MAG: rhodanese-related sulfurtransferase [Pseudomonadota bacterium]
MFTVAALYHFTRFDEAAALKKPLAALCCGEGVRGTLLLAEEGINGTIAGSRAAIDAVIAHVRALPGCADLEWKESEASAQPFRHMKVRLKKEIVTLGQPGVDPSTRVGTYVAPADWNAVIAAPDVALIDTRNDYEVGIGAFEGAIDPETAAFTDFPDWFRANRERFQGKRIAMYCTGGIRCEKASSWLLGEGVEEVLHLKGGILKYLEETPEEDSLWRGECFVFDGRVSVGHGLREGEHDLCHACRRPIDAAAKAHPAYEPGVQCHQCVDHFTDADRDRFRERQKQIRLARARGEEHLSGS